MVKFWRNAVVSAHCGIQDAISKSIQDGWWCLKIVTKARSGDIGFNVELRMGPRPDEADGVKGPVVCFWMIPRSQYYT